METSASDYLLLPGLLTFFGALVYGLTLDGGLRNLRLPPSRWVGIGLVALAVFIGLKPAWQMATDVVYRSMVAGLGKKITIAHWAGFLLPFIALLVCLGFEFASRGRVARLRMTSAPEAAA